MTNEERARVNESALRTIADDIEEIRKELYSYSILEESKQEVDDELFELQSKIRDVAETVGCYA